MPPRVKLCAIAKNEGAYLPEWVFHHLRFGFDAIEVWVNETTDPSRRILNRITALHPQVTQKNVDPLFAECFADGTNFQEAAYTRLYRKARRQGFTHVAYLDLDEYWMPRDATTPITAFVSDDPRVNVVSFPWLLDHPEPDATAFTPPFSGELHLQWDPHVKSMVVVDDSIRRIHAHTAHTRSGRKLFVRDPFPLEDKHEQKLGAVVTWDFLHERWDTIPEAFVVHTKHRSQVEYLSSLGQGVRRSQVSGEFKVNRRGYVPTSAPVLTFAMPADVHAEYHLRREAFLAELGVDEDVAVSRAHHLHHGDAIIERLVRDREAFDALKHALPGITDPRLEAAYPSERP